MQHIKHTFPRLHSSKYAIATYVLMLKSMRINGKIFNHHQKKGTFSPHLTTSAWALVQPLRESETDHTWLFWSVIENLFLTYRRMVNLFSSLTDKSPQYWCSSILPCCLAVFVSSCLWLLISALIVTITHWSAAPYCSHELPAVAQSLTDIWLWWPC